MDADELKREEVRQYLKCGLTDLIKLLGRHFKSLDLQAVTIILGVAVAHQIPGEMIWVRLYGPSRSGKTEMLRAVAAHPDSVQMEVITAASIRGGFRGGHRLLDRVTGKLVITKDIAAILTAKREARNEVFGVLRNVKDGTLISDFGTTEDAIEQKVKFDWLLATTPVFAQYKQMEDLLGARYIDLEWRPGQRAEMAQQALENNPVLESQIRPAIAQAVCGLIEAAKQSSQLLVGIELLDEEAKKIVADWADLTALLRSPVARDRQHNVRFHPSAEVGTDLAQGLRRIAEGLSILGVEDIKPQVARLCQDSMPFDRRKLLLQVLEKEVYPPGFDSQVKYHLDDLRLLGVVDNKYSIRPELTERIGHLFSYFT